VIVWPDLLEPRTAQWDITGGRVAGGRSLGGVTQIGRFDGGPFWTLNMGGIFAFDVQRVKLARAMQGLLDSGSPIEVGTYEDPFAPLPAGASFGTVPHSDGTPFSDTAEYELTPITASFAADAALRATTVTLSLTTTGAIVGGEEFSVVNSDYVRKHRVLQITGGTDMAPVVSITPPLRASVVSGQAVDFNNPRSVMQLVSMPINLEPGDECPRSTFDAQFVEYFD
jgi:hypothetical protein